MTDVVSDLPLVLADDTGPRRRPALGYAMTLAGAALFGINGSVVKVLLDASGLSTPRLTELRTTGAVVCLLAVLGLVAPRRLRITRQEVPFFLLYGVCCFVVVQWLYFVAIERLPIGIAVLVQYTAPILVALWAMLVWRQPVRGRVWAALVLALAGITLVAEAWSGLELDGVGIAAAAGAAVSLAAYFIVGERAVTRRDPLSLLTIALTFAAAFWAVTQPWWRFPFAALEGTTSLGGTLEAVSLPAWALVAIMVVPGTILPFALGLAALRHLPATHVALVAMTEPIAAGLVAWAWLDESLSAIQLGGAAVTLLGIVLAQTARRGQATGRGPASAARRDPARLR